MHKFAKKFSRPGGWRLPVSLAFSAALSLTACSFATEAQQVTKVVASDKRSSLQPLSQFRDCEHCPEMVVIPAGSYVAGYTDAERALTQRAGIPPKVKVNISKPFAIGKYELTIAEFRACIEDGGCHFRRKQPDPNFGFITGMESFQPPEVIWAITGESHGTPYDRLPMVNLSVEDIQAFLAWLSRRTGHVYRLPTAVEWTYAARAGTGFAYPWGDEPKRNMAFTRGMFDEGRYPTLHGVNRYQVGLLPPNRWGLYDITGNVSEIVFDCRYRPDTKPAPTLQFKTIVGVRLCTKGGDFAGGIRPEVPEPIGRGASMDAGSVISSANGIRVVSDF